MTVKSSESENAAGGQGLLKATAAYHICSVVFCNDVMGCYFFNTVVVL